MPKADPVLVHDLLLREQQNPNMLTGNTTKAVK